MVMYYFISTVFFTAKVIAIFSLYRLEFIAVILLHERICEVHLH